MRIVLLVIVVALVALWMSRRKNEPETIQAARHTGAPDEGEDKALAKRDRRAVAAGLLPRERIGTKSGRTFDPRIPPVVAAAVRGDWVPGAELLRVVDGKWAERSEVVAHLEGVAAEDDAFLVAWEEALPDDPDAALVRAASTVTLAWKIRGAKRATHTSREQFAGFHETLDRARAETARAAELNPRDPAPLVHEIALALGLGYPHARMRELWDRLVALDPHHFHGHKLALQYWCAKWRGSRELALEFAEKAARGAPPESLLAVLPLMALFEHEDDHENPYTNPVALEWTEAAREAVAGAPDSWRSRETRHLVGYFLARQERYAEALEQFRQVDDEIGFLPWSYYADPAEPYTRLRDRALRKAG
ncbi:hypothetical protein ACWIG4_16705 [Streptomyces sp. NPDC002248]